MRYWGYLAVIVMLCGSASAQSASGSSARAPQANDEVARGLFQAGKSAYQAGSYQGLGSYQGRGLVPGDWCQWGLVPEY